MKIAIMGFGTVGSGAYESARIAGGILPEIRISNS